jgi:Avidin family
MNERNDLSDVDFRGRWVNQNGSILSIDVQKERRIGGRFISTKGRAAQNISYPVDGCINGELASFIVNFASDAADLRSMTSFSGRYARGADGTERLHTVWILARQYEDDARTKPTHLWNSFVTNSDVFERRAEAD